VPHGAALIRFAEAATRCSGDLEVARSQLVDAIGSEAFVEAAATIGIFNGLVRVADATGIPLDENIRDSSGELRAKLGLNAFGSARNTNLETGTTRPQSALGDEGNEGDGRPPNVAQLFR
jgi:hypothetical protein